MKLPEALQPCGLAIRTRPLRVAVRAAVDPAQRRWLLPR